MRTLSSRKVCSRARRVGPGISLLTTVASPASDTVGESFNGGGGNTSLSQTFTIATTNYLLQTIDIYVSGGNGGNL